MKLNPIIIHKDIEITCENVRGRIDRIYYIILCNFCHKEAKKYRRDALYCGSTCRKRAELARKAKVKKTVNE